MVSLSLKPSLFLIPLNLHFTDFMENASRSDNMGKIFGYARVSTQEQNKQYKIKEFADMTGVSKSVYIGL